MADTEYIPTGDTRSDEDLVLAVATGDPTALGELAARYRHSMAAAAGSVLHQQGRIAEVEDAVQETLVAIMTGRAEAFVPGRAPVGAWLWAITRYVAPHVGRTNHHPETIMYTVELTEPVATASGRFVAPDPYTAATETDAAHQRHEAEMAYAAELVATLPRGLRAACDLVYLRGMTRQDAAAELGIPEATLKSRIRRARATLTTRAAEDAYQHAGTGCLADPGR